MKTIHKYPLVIVHEQPIQMPSGAEILSVAVQNETPCLWALVETENPMQKRSIVIVGTGHPAPEGNYRFVGTVMLCGGVLVWHVFQRPE